MYLYFMVAMAAALMTPATSQSVAPRVEPVASPAITVEAPAAPKRVRKRRAPTIIAPAPPAPAPVELMTLGWADEDEVPIF